VNEHRSKVDRPVGSRHIPDVGPQERLVDVAEDARAEAPLLLFGSGRLHLSRAHARSGRGARVLLAYQLALAFDARAVAAEWFAGRFVVPSYLVPNNRAPPDALPLAPPRSRNAWVRALRV